MLNDWLIQNSRGKILLLRHGRVEAPDDAKRFIGQSDLPLSEAGRRQAARWQSRLAAVPLGTVVASDLSRCRETARIIAAGDQRVETAAGLREIDLGQWDGLPINEVKRRWPDAYRQRGEDLAGFRPPAGESFLDLQRRVVPAFETVLDRFPAPLLIVTHAGVIRMLLCHILGMPVENLFRIALDYAALALIDRRADGYRVQALNLKAERRQARPDMEKRFAGHG